MLDVPVGDHLAHEVETPAADGRRVGPSLAPLEAGTGVGDGDAHRSLAADDLDLDRVAGADPRVPHRVRDELGDDELETVEAGAADQAGDGRERRTGPGRRIRAGGDLEEDATGRLRLRGGLGHREK